MYFDVDINWPLTLTLIFLVVEIKSSLTVAIDVFVGIELLILDIFGICWKKQSDIFFTIHKKKSFQISFSDTSDIFFFC